MANTLKQTIGVGTTANDGLGDPIRTGGQKINTNVTTLFRGNKVIISLQTSLADFITNEFDTNETFMVENGTIIEITNVSSEKEYYLKYQNTGSLSTDYVNINSVGQFVHLIGNETIEGNKRFDNFIAQNFTDIASVQDIPDISGIRNTLKITGNTNVQTMNPGTLPQGTFVYIYANEAFTIEHLANGSPNEFYFNSGEDFTFAANEIALFCLGEGQIWTEISMNSVKGKWKDDGTYLTIRTPRIAKFSKRVEFYQGADLFSQNNLTLGEDGNYFKITTITNQIQLIESNKWQKGSHIALELATGARVKHLATASSTFYPISLASGSDFQAVKKTVLELYLNEDNIWIEANGTSLTSTLKTDYIDFDVNITNFSTQSSGITLSYSGTNTVDWGDGSIIETFIAGVEKVHNYTANGTYKVRIISTDLTKITSFESDNSRIIGVVDIQKLTGLTYLDVTSNLITDVKYANNLFQRFYIGSNNLKEIFDFPSISFLLQFSSVTNLKYSSFKNSTFPYFYAFNSTNLINLDLSNLDITNTIRIDGCTALNQIILNLSKNNLKNLQFNGCTSLTQITLPTSNFTSIIGNNCSLLSLINFNINTTLIGDLVLNSLTSLISINLSNLTLTGGLNLESCSNLTTLTNPNASSIFTYIFLAYTKISNLDLSSFSFSATKSANRLECGTYLTSLKLNNYDSTHINGLVLTNNSGLTSIEWTGTNMFKYCNVTGCALIESEIDELISIALNSCIS